MSETVHQVKKAAQSMPLLPAEYENKIIGWALEKGIADPDNARRQFDKFLEEVQELQEEHDNFKFGADGNLAELECEAGDVLVTLVIYLYQRGSSLPSAMQSAWEKIKDRTGKTINGQFVKQSDLNDEQ